MKNLLVIPLLACLFITSCTKDRGTLDLTFTKATAIYGDLEAVRAMPLNSTAKAIDNPGKIFIGNEFLLIGEEGQGIHVYDNTAPANPQNVGFINIPLNKEFYVEGNMIFAESHYDMLKIDVSDFLNPVLVSRATNAFATPLVNDQGQELIGFNYKEVTEKIKIQSIEYDQIAENEALYYDYTESLIPPSVVPSSFSGTSNNQIGTVNKIAYLNNMVYAISNSKIHVLSDNGSSLVKTNEVLGSMDMQTIYPQEGLLFVGTRSSMEIYDVSSPSNPNYESSYPHTDACDPVLPFENDVAYVTVRTGDFSNCPGDENELLVLDISDVNQPEQRSAIEQVSPYGMAIENNVLYVGNGAAGLYMYDITNRFNPVLMGSNPNIQAYDVIPHPSITNLILTSGPAGIEQYEYNLETLEFNLISHIQI